MDVVLLSELSDLASVVDTISSNTAANNTASSTGTLSQKLTHLCQQLGTSSDAASSGTTSGGTAMAKLNAILSANINHGIKTVTSAGNTTWTCPAGVYSVLVDVIGASGGGGGGAGGGEGEVPRLLRARRCVCGPLGLRGLVVQRENVQHRASRSPQPRGEDARAHGGQARRNACPHPRVVPSATGNVQMY